jgi:hypothetical protein
MFLVFRRLLRDLYHSDFGCSLLFSSPTSCVLENGLVFEKAAVNTTVSRLVQAPAERLKNLAHDHPQYAKMLARGAPVDLYTASVSLILHPWNPHAPTVHANYRYCACGRLWMCLLAGFGVFASLVSPTLSHSTFALIAETFLSLPRRIIMIFTSSCISPFCPSQSN